MNRTLFPRMAVCLGCLLAACGDNAAPAPDEVEPGAGGTGPIAGGSGGSEAGSGDPTGGGGASVGGSANPSAPDAATSDVVASVPSDASHPGDASDVGAITLPSRVLLYSLGAAGVIPTVLAQLATL